MKPSIDPSQWTYTDYVCFLNSHGFHNLDTLNKYLEWGSAARFSPTVRQPEFSKTMLFEITKNTTRISDLSELNKLRILLREWTNGSKEPSSPGLGTPSGRIVLVENPAPALIDTLGGLLNIDPAFFSEHLKDNHPADFGPSPLSSTKPQSRDMFTVEYYHAFTPLECPKDVESLQLQAHNNYPRRIELIPKQPRQKVALARRKISFWLRDSRLTEPWLSVILIDAPPTNFSIGPTSFSAIPPSQQLPTAPFSNGYLDFIPIRKPQHKDYHDFRSCRSPQEPQPSNPFNDLLCHYSIQTRDGLFFNSPPTLPTLARPCLQLAASETTHTLSFLSSLLSHPLPSNPNPHTLRRALDRTIAIDTLLTTHKHTLSRTKDFITTTTSPASMGADTPQDYRSLLSTTHHLRALTDSHTQHLTALLTTHAASNFASLAHSAVSASQLLRLLLIIALLYAPLALTFAVLTLPVTFAPGQGYLAILLPVSVVVTVLVMSMVVPGWRGTVWGRVGDVFRGGVRERQVLRGERFKRHREGGERVWVNSNNVDAGHKEDV